MAEAEEKDEDFGVVPGIQFAAAESFVDAVFRFLEDKVVEGALIRGEVELD